MIRKLAAEFIGTFWLVLGGCGSAVLAATFPETGIGFVGVSFAFGLTVLTMAYAIGHISGCHLNPAVSIGLLLGGRFPAKELVPYIIAQVLGAIAAAGDPDNPEDWAYIQKYSPYQNLKEGVDYPTPFIFTTTKDDRVHPGHARKLAARMESMGHSLYW